MQFTLSQSYQEYQGAYDMFVFDFFFLANNLTMPKIYHSRDAKEMFS